MNKKSFISYDIKQNKKLGTIEINVVLRGQASSQDDNAIVSWQKFKTSNARALLVDQGYDLGTCIQESSMLVNHSGDVTGTWIFTHDSEAPSTLKDPPTRRRTKRTKTNRTKRE